MPCAPCSFCSIHQAATTTTTTTTGGSADAIYHARQAAVNTIDVFFAHELTTVLLLADSAAPGQPSFYQRGWPS